MSKKITILGAGESGLGAALLGIQQGYQVFVSDYGKIKSETKEILAKNKITWEEGQHSVNKILESEAVIKSPGIPKKASIIKLLKDKNIPVWSEIEFASKFTSKKIIAITGSNGKTTTTSLIAHMLRKTDKRIGVGGNIGNSFAALVLNDKDYDLYVLEVSSFQLDDIADFKPYISILLNITPDHLDQYDYDIEKYADAKLRITENQTASDYFLFNADDHLTRKTIRKKKIYAKQLGFSLKDDAQPAFANDTDLIIKYPDTLTMKIEEMALMGKHNVSNSLAAALNGNILKVRKQAIKDSLTDFEAVEHRLEKVLQIHGIQFINDSKATNVNATYYALQSMNTPTIWIVGGKDKGNDYEELIPLIKKKVKAIVCLGADNQKLIETFTPHVNQIIETNNMKDAVNSAYMLGKPGDTVLLSPACASFDLFKNYEDRGEQFKNEVKNL